MVCVCLPIALHPSAPTKGQPLFLPQQLLDPSMSLPSLPPGPHLLRLSLYWSCRLGGAMLHQRCSSVRVETHAVDLNVQKVSKKCPLAPWPLNIIFNLHNMLGVALGNSSPSPEECQIKLHQGQASGGSFRVIAWQRSIK